MKNNLNSNVIDKIKELDFQDDSILKNYEGLEEVWVDLQQQHLDEFGTEPDLRLRVRQMRELTNLNLKYIISRERVILNHINILEEKLKDQKIEHFKFFDTLEKITSYKKFDIDPFSYTVIKWFYTLKNMAENGRSKGE